MSHRACSLRCLFALLRTLGSMEPELRPGIVRRTWHLKRWSDGTLRFFACLDCECACVIAGQTGLRQRRHRYRNDYRTTKLNRANQCKNAPAPSSQACEAARTNSVNCMRARACPAALSHTEMCDFQRVMLHHCHASKRMCLQTQ